MNEQPRILYLEDSPDDAELLKLELTRQGIISEFKWVKTKKEFERALKEEFDLIILDLNLGGFDGKNALQIVRGRGLDTPCIFVSGTYGEDVLAGVMELGANDFLLKDRLGRLSTAVTHALNDKRLKDEKNKADSARLESEHRMSSMLENLQLVAIMLDAQGNVIFCNDYLLKITGQERVHVLGNNWFEEFLPEEWADIKTLFFGTIQTGELPSHYEYPIKTNSGELRSIYWNNTFLKDESGNIYGVACIGEDVTERKKIEEIKNRSIERLERSEAQAGLGSWEFEPATGAGWWSKEMYRLLCFEEPIGDAQQAPPFPEFLEHIHPEDREKIQNELLKMRAGELPVSMEYRSNPICGPEMILYPTYQIERDQDGKLVKYSGTLLNITDRKEAEKQIRESEDRYRSLIQQLPVAIYQDDFDKEGTNLFSSDQVINILGYPASYYAEHPTAWLEQVYPDDLQLALETIKKIMKDGAGTSEYRWIRQDGQIVWVRDTATLIRENNGNPKYIQGFLEDITERKRAEERLRESETKYRSLIQQLPAIVYQHGLDEKHSTIFISDQVEKILGYAATYYMDNPIVWHDQIHPDDYHLAITELDDIMKSSSEIAEYRCIKKDGDVVWIKDSATLIRDENGSPLYIQGFLEDITARKQAEERLRESELKLRAMLDTMSEGIALNEIITDKNGDMIDYKVLEVNKAFYSTADFSYTEVIGSRATELYKMTPDVIKAFWNERKGKTDVQHTEFVSPINQKNYYISTSPFVDGKFVTSFFDITGLKRTEQALRENEFKLNTMLQTLVDGVVMVDLDGSIVFANRSSEKILGISHDAIEGKYYQSREWQQMNADGTPYPLDQLPLAIALREKRAVDAVEHLIVALNGETKWLSVNAAPLFNSNDELYGALAGFQDISERKLAEQALIETEEKYRSLVERVPDLIYTAEAGEDGIWTFVGPQIEDLLGFTPQEWMAQPGLWYSQVHPNDREEQIKVEQQIINLGGSFSSEYRMYRKDGSMIWVRDKAHISSRPTDNKPIIQGIITNITESKMAEQESKFLSEIIERSLNEIYIFDSQTLKFKHLNQGALQNIQYTLDEAKALTPVDIKPDFTEASFRETIQPLLSGEKESLVFETVHQRADRTTYPVEVHLQLVKTDTGADFLAVIYDNTESKEASERINQFQTLLDDSNDAIFVIDTATSQYEDFNKTACTYLGYSDKELRTLGVIDVAEHVPDMAAWQERVELVRENNGLTFETVYKRKDESLFPVEVSAKLRKFGDREWITAIVRDISQRKQANEELHISEQRFRTLVEQAPFGIQVFQTDGLLIQANLTWERIWGTPASVVAGKYNALLDPQNQENGSIEYIRKAFNGQSITLPDILYDPATSNQPGRKRWIRTHAYPIKDSDGITMNVVVINLDITDRKEYERELTRHAANMVALSDFSRQVITSLNLKEVFRETHQVTAKLMPCDSFVISMLDRTKEHMEDAFLWDDGREWPGEVYEPDKYLPGYIVRTGAALRVNHWDESHYIMTGSTEFGAEGKETLSVLAVPLIDAKGDTVGMLSTQAYEADAYTSEHEQLLSTLSGHVSKALENANLFNDLQRELVDHKTAEERIKKQVKRLEGLHQIDMAITSGLEIRNSLNLMLDQVLSLLEVDAADILLLEPHTHVLRYSAGRGFISNGIQNTALKLEQGHAGKAAYERRSKFISDLIRVPDDAVRAMSISQEKFTSYYAIPLVAKGQVKGVLEIFNRANIKPDDEWMGFAETMAHQAAIIIEDTQLFDQLQRSNFELSSAYDATIEGWSRAMDLRDHETEGHTQRVTELTVKLAQKMGIDGQQIIHIYRGGLLHDIGKLGVPDHILLKDDKLTDEEWEIMRRHPVYAYEMLSSINYLKPALTIPHYHHERWDGTGYPHKLKGNNIPVEARIFAIADVWDAVTSDRHYRKAWPRNQALNHIREQSGKHFDPQVVQAFFELIAET